MFLDKKRIINTLDNHQKLISMISNEILPIKEALINDVKDIRDIIETATKKEKQ
jgi:hypothetical protein